MNGHQTPLDLLAFAASNRHHPHLDTRPDDEDQGNWDHNQTRVNNMPGHQNSLLDTRPNNEVQRSWDHNQTRRQRLSRYTDLRRNALMRHFENNELDTGLGSLEQIQVSAPSGDEYHNVSLPVVQDATMEWTHGSIISRNAVDGNGLNGHGRANFAIGREYNGDAPRSVPSTNAIVNGIYGDDINGRGRENYPIGRESNGNAPQSILSTNIAVEMPESQHPLIVRWAPGLNYLETGQRRRLRSPQPLMLRFGDFPPAPMSQGHGTQLYTSDGSQSPVPSTPCSSPRRSPTGSANEAPNSLEPLPEQDAEQGTGSNAMVSFCLLQSTDTKP